jgi:hypothetical protein
MKKVLFPLMFICLVSTSILAQNSQDKSGSLALTGTFSIDAGSSKDKNGNVTTDGPKTTDLTILPTVEYFITDRFSAGLGVGVAMNRSKSVETVGTITTTTTSTSTRPVIMPYARMYFPMGEKVSFFGQAQVYIKPGAQKTTTESGNVSTTEKLKRFYMEAGLAPGISVALSEKIAIDATFGFIGYYGQKYETGTNSTQTSGDFLFSIDPSSITFSLKFFLF